MFTLADYETLFHSNPTAAVLPVTQMSTAKAIQSYVDGLFMTQAQLGFVAACRCGNLTGNYIGITCPICHTPVTTNFADEITYQNWLEIPPFAPPILTGQMYRILQSQLGSVVTPDGTHASLIDVLLDNRLQLPPKFAAQIPQTGMQYFHDHFDEIMEFLFSVLDRRRRKKPKRRSSPKGRISKKSQTAQLNIPMLRRVIEKYRDRLFIRHIPILDPTLHLVKQYGRSRTIDPMAPYVIDAIQKLSVVVHTFNTSAEIRQADIDYQTLQFARCCWNYQLEIQRLVLFKKRCCIRQGVLGVRMNFTARAVITPLVEEYSIDEIHLPWQCAVMMYRFEIINLLVNRHSYTEQDAVATVTTAESMYVEVIDQIFQTLVAESPARTLGIDPKPGLPVLVNRNPSIKHGAVQYQIATRIKTDIEDKTISVPPSSITASNADFDGDQENLMSIKETKMIPYLMALHPMTTMLGGADPGINTDVIISPPLANALQAFARP